MKKRHRVLSQAPAQSSDVSDAAFDLEHLSRQTYLTVPETQTYLRFPSLSAVYSWAHKNLIPRCKRGRTVLFLRRDLDEAVQGITEGRGRRRV